MSQILDRSLHERRCSERMRDEEYRAAYEQAAGAIAQSDHIIRMLDEVRADLGISKAELARRIDRNASSIRRLFTAHQAKPELPLIAEIADALGLRLALARSFTGRCNVYVAYNVGRRQRQRGQRASQGPPLGVAAVEPARDGGQPRDRMARVQVSDETWSAFRAGLGATPVGVALGRLVEREVAAQRRCDAPDADAVRAAVVEGRAVVAELQQLLGRLDRP
jgi:DNA-binding phage protein